MEWVLPGSRSRTLVVRTLRPDDAPGLDALYRGLSPDDAYLRFFGVSRPPISFVSAMAHVAERGGYGVVALVDGRLVAEAAWWLLPNGDAEVGVTVAREWRGWLGPYLFDAVRSEAAARGVPNLEADVLLANQPMLALVRSRPYVLGESLDFATVRAIMGTRPPTPVWPPLARHPRVLVESPSGHWQEEQEARRAGCDVLVCPGASTPGRCPALARGVVCPLAVGADALVVHVDPPDPLLAAHARLHPSVPVVSRLEDIARPIHAPRPPDAR